MRKIVLTFGIISGVVWAALTAIMLPLCMSGRIDFDKSEIAGYSGMLLSFLLVFFGIRSYREKIGGGSITFGKAVLVGLGITLISCAFYVTSWEIVYFNFIPDFGERYAAYSLEKMRAKGATPAELAAKQQEMARFKEIYRNPLINIGITFLEVFPVGLIVTLVSAAILRRKGEPGTPRGAVAAA